MLTTRKLWSPQLCVLQEVLCCSGQHCSHNSISCPLFECSGCNAESLVVSVTPYEGLHQIKSLGRPDTGTQGEVQQDGRACVVIIGATLPALHSFIYSSVSSQHFFDARHDVFLSNHYLNQIQVGREDSDLTPIKQLGRCLTFSSLKSSTQCQKRLASV